MVTAVALGVGFVCSRTNVTVNGGVCWGFQDSRTGTEFVDSHDQRVRHSRFCSTGEQ